jgi:hypothetical protein
VTAAARRAVAIGTMAHAALARSDGRAHVVTRLQRSTYLTAAGEVVWLGGLDATLHPRAVLTTAPVTSDDAVDVDVGALVPWSPPVCVAPPAALLADRWRALDLASVGTPGGFGALLVGRPLTFPLLGAREDAEALARACTRDEAMAAADAALGLLGLGAGLTPSGDDYVGGALFARTLLGDRAPAWRAAVERVLAAAVTRTHPISATLLADLASGRGWAPLHDLMLSLAAGSAADAVAAARRLVALGHTSGWDLLAGVAAGLGAVAC